MEILLATHNAHKLKECRAILEPLGITLLAAVDVGGIPDVEETGTTFVENAALKAVETARYTGRTVIADDSGLEVMALGGEPGVYSARYAGPGTDYQQKMQKVLNLLQPHTDRSARFVCVIALASPEGLIDTVEGEVRGRIAMAPSGTDGFGYDPIFVPDGRSETFAELTATEKDGMSHRGNALRKAVARGIFNLTP